MQLLWPPRAGDLRADDVVAAEVRSGPPGRPWVAMNMVTSLDGAVSVDGRSGGLGGPGDRQVFSALRSVADVVLVGAGTVRAERYGMPKDPTTALAVVSASLDLPDDLPLFDHPDRRPIVLTTTQAPSDARTQLGERAEIIDVGRDTVDLALAIDLLGGRGARVILAEGGPRLNGQLWSADLVDEVCVTIAAVVVAGDAGRIVAGPALEPPRTLLLDRLLRSGDELCARYVRPR